jgi:hypothetical protein
MLLTYADMDDADDPAGTPCGLIKALRECRTNFTGGRDRSSYRRRLVSRATLGPGLRRDDEKCGMM